MSVTASLTRRNFVLAAAAASLAALPALALAEEKKDEKAAEEPKGADVEGTWVMIAAIVIGILTGIASAYRTVLPLLKERGGEKPKGRSFNDHI